MIYKFAETAEEIEQIHKLNFEIFVKELKQYPVTTDGFLIDRFHEDNSYYICKFNEEVIGMLALRHARPFSLDQKIPNLDSYLPKFEKIFELRLLAIKPQFRKGTILWRLIHGGIHSYLSDNFDLAIISGVTTQAHIYQKLGFESFHTPLPAGDAVYIPMYITKERFLTLNSRVIDRNPHSH